MDNNFDNAPKDTQPVYTDPNADVKPEQETETKTEAGAQEQTQDTYQDTRNNQNYDRYQYTQGYQKYQDNPDYHTGSQTSYRQKNYNGMDTSPMSMGDWVLTILAAMIPCAGIILYIVWAFSSTGNVNRRNFCRAQLVIMAVVFVLYLVLFFVFGVAMLGIFGGR